MHEILYIYANTYFDFKRSLLYFVTRLKLLGREFDSEQKSKQ